MFLGAFGSPPGEGFGADKAAGARPGAALGTDTPRAPPFNVPPPSSVPPPCHLGAVRVLLPAPRSPPARSDPGKRLRRLPLPPSPPPPPFIYYYYVFFFLPLPPPAPPFSTAEKAQQLQNTPKK